MRRNRLKWIRTNEAQPRLTAPGVYRRAVAVSFDFPAANPGEKIQLSFLAQSGGSFPIATVCTGVTVDAAGTATFTLGGTTSFPHQVSFTPATGVSNYQSDPTVTGPLPDIWFGPDLPINLLANATSGFTPTNWNILVEECDLSEA